MNSIQTHSRKSLLLRTGFMLLGCLLLGQAAFTALAPIEKTPAHVITSPPTGPRYVSKKIEDVQVGDYVVARDEVTGELSSKPVVKLFPNTSDHLRVLTIVSDSLNEQQLIETTDEHPFWVVDKGWVSANDLIPGDTLLDSDGTTATLIDSVHQPQPNGVAVYNFEVQDAHTYHVKAGGTRGPPLLVHNMCTTGEIIALQRIKNRNSTQAAQTIHQRINQRAIPKGRSLIRHPFADGAVHVTTSERLKSFKQLGSKTYGSPIDGLFVSPKGQIDSLLSGVSSRSEIEIALGLKRGSLNGGRLVRIDIDNPFGRGLRLPDPASGNEFHLPGTGLTIGGLNEGVVNAPLIGTWGVRKSVIRGGL